MGTGIDLFCQRWMLSWKRYVLTFMIAAVWKFSQNGGNHGQNV